MALSMLMLAGAPLSAAEPEDAVQADWILDKLARPAPMRTGFVELRESRLLKTPLRSSGEYRRPAVGVLVREVRAPYAETTTPADAQPPRTLLASAARAAGQADDAAAFAGLCHGDDSR